MKEARKICSDKVFLLIVKDPTNNVLNVALTEKDQVIEINFKMDNVSMRDNSIFISKQIRYCIMICCILH